MFIRKKFLKRRRNILALKEALIRKRRLKKHSGVIGGMANTFMINYGKSNGRKKNLETLNF